MLAAAPPPPFIQSVQMVDASVGYLVGGRATATVVRLFRTHDGGSTWRDVSPGAVLAPPTTVGRRAVYVPVRVRGAVVVERSGDGGATWRPSAPIRDGRAVGAGSVVRVDARHLFLALGEGAAAGSSAQSIWRSDDGARTWRFVSRTQGPAHPPRPGELPFGCDKTGVGFATPRRGWAGGACAGGPAFLYRTDDAGKTWRQLRLPGAANCACETSPPRFFTPRRGAFSVVGGLARGSNAPTARIEWTIDGGAHWRATTSPVARVTGEPGLPAAGVAWVFGGRRVTGPWRLLARTTDSGRHWRLVRLPFDAGTHTFDVVSADVAFAVAADQHTLLRTTDGGRAWRRIR